MDRPGDTRRVGKPLLGRASLVFTPRVRSCTYFRFWGFQAFVDTPGGASLEGGAPVAVLQPISDYYTYSCIYEFSRILLSLVLIPYHRVIRLSGGYGL